VEAAALEIHVPSVEAGAVQMAAENRSYLEVAVSFRAEAGTGEVRRSGVGAENCDRGSENRDWMRN